MTVDDGAFHLAPAVTPRRRVDLDTVRNLAVICIAADMAQIAEGVQIVEYGLPARAFTLWSIFTQAAQYYSLFKVVLL